MKIYPSVFIILTISLSSCQGASLSETILNSIKYKGDKVLQILEEKKNTAEDIFDIKQSTLYNILSLKTNAFLDVFSRARSALGSIVKLKTDIVRHKKDEISNIIDILQAKPGCEVVATEVRIIINRA